MLQDSFIETNVKRENGASGFVFNCVLVLAAIFLCFFICYIPLTYGLNIWMITGTVSFGIVAGVVILIKRQNKVYELEISNDLVDCAAILSNSKRDELLSFSLKDCEYIGPVTSDRFENDKTNSNYVLKLTDYKNFPIEDKYWYFYYTVEGVKITVVFIYKDEMYDVFRRYCPRGVISKFNLDKMTKEKTVKGNE